MSGSGKGGRNGDTDAGAVRKAVEAIAEEMAGETDRGQASRMLPQLERADTASFGIAVCTASGDVVAAGDADTPFAIQSISKVFSLTLALAAHGGGVWKRVGREPSGDPYNSIVDLERHEGMPRNPFINAGALVVVDMLVQDHRERHGGKTPLPDPVHDFISKQLDGEAFGMDDGMAGSESDSSFKNRALANLAKSFGNFHSEVDDVIEVYVRQCAVMLSCRQLARAGRYLMLERAGSDGGPDPREARRARRINALMLTCGQYDGSGDFAFRVGLPAKSGIGGGILAVVPNTATVAVWSPGLDDYGNSLLGTLALERLSERLDWSVFGSIGGGRTSART